MKKLILVLMVLILAGAAQAASIPLVNPGFEGPGWAYWNWNGSTGGDSNSRSGNWCLKVGTDKTADWEGGAGAFQEFPVDGSPISVGSVIYFDGYARTTGTRPRASLIICYMDTSDKELARSERDLAGFAPMPNWTYGKVVGMVPPGCTKVKFEIAQCGGQGYGYFDDHTAETDTSYDPCDPNDSTNMILNHSFENAIADPQGRMIPDFWLPCTQSGHNGVYDHNQTDHNQVIDGTCYDAYAYWMLDHNSTGPGQEGSSAVHDILFDTVVKHAYRLGVYLRNPGAAEASVDIGFDYHTGTTYKDEDVKTVSVPADNTWHYYECTRARLPIGDNMRCLIRVFDATIHIDEVALHDMGETPCAVARYNAHANDVDPFPLLPGDMDEDCYVNFLDMELMLEDWLDCALPDACCP